MIKKQPYTTEFSEDPDSDESTTGVLPDQISQAVVSATDWTTETILSQLEQGNILLTPPFQRRDAWTVQKKSQFIESLILGLPIPQVVLAVQASSRAKFLVLDGKQRLLTLLQFSGKASGKNNGFAFKGMVIRKDLEGKTYADLNSDNALRDDFDSLLNQTVRSVVIRNWPSVDFLHTVFVRLNTGSVPLSPQELRQALFPGSFSDWADVMSAESPGLKSLLGISDPDFRMRDVELLVRFLSFFFFMEKYDGNLKRFLDASCEKFNVKWDVYKDDVEKQKLNFELAIEAGQKIFGEDCLGKKWMGDDYQRRLNRAILDTQLYYLSIPHVREECLLKTQQVQSAFKNMCNTSSAFRTSVETTTKSISATFDRYQLWGLELSHALGIQLPTPTMTSENRIKFPT